jgi:hypothetical protein
MLRRVRNRLRYLPGNVVNRSFALREDIDDFRATPVPERLRN